MENEERTPVVGVLLCIVACFALFIYIGWLHWIFGAICLVLAYPTYALFAREMKLTHGSGGIAVGLMGAGLFFLYAGVIIGSIIHIVQRVLN